MSCNMMIPDVLSGIRSMKVHSRVLVAAGACALGLAAGAAHAGGPGGSYVQGAYADWDDADDGFNAGGSLMISPSLRLFGDYTDTDLEQLRLGGGVILPMASPLGLEIGGSYQNLQVDNPGPGGLDDDGFGVHGIARLAATPEFTLAGKVEYVFRDDIDDELVYGVDADYRFLPQLSGFVSYEVYDEIDNDLFMAGARLHF